MILHDEYGRRVASTPAARGGPPPASVPGALSRDTASRGAAFCGVAFGRAAFDGVAFDRAAAYGAVFGSAVASAGPGMRAGVCVGATVVISLGKPDAGQPAGGGTRSAAAVDQGLGIIQDLDLHG